MNTKTMIAHQNAVRDYSICPCSTPLSLPNCHKNQRWHSGSRFLSFPFSPPSISPAKLSRKFKCKPISNVVQTSHDYQTFSNKAVAKLVSVVGDGSVSPLKDVPWEDVMNHTATRLKWVDEGYEMSVFTDRVLVQSVQDSSSSIEENEIKLVLAQTDILIIISVQNHDSVKWILQNTERIPTVICFHCSPALQNKLGGLQVSTSNTNIFDKLLLSREGNQTKESLEVLRTVYEAWGRCNSDDIRFSLLVLINSYVRPVPILKSLRAKGISTLSCMIKNCGPQILDCLLDPNCRKALVCLNKCAPTDQVCSYRCIASYESPKLEAFSLCVLQKHNCLGLDAEISMKPDVQPLLSFRGSLLSHDVAEDLFVGWLGESECSWRVVAGQNPAYDQFPCQYQLFYRGKAKGSFWYEPVFQVQTLDGQIVWRRRRYRVKRGAIPGTFFFTVLDNGVVSKEFWRIVDVTDDLSWGLFYYSGAAQAAGQSYTGAVLVTPDGAWPSKAEARNPSCVGSLINLWPVSYEKARAVYGEEPMRNPFCIRSVVLARTRVCFRIDRFTMATVSGGVVEREENMEKSREANAKAEEEKKKREEEIEKILMEKIGPPPEKPLPGDCCGSGCEPCVWDTYFDQLQEYKKEKDFVLKSLSPP